MSRTLPRFAVAPRRRGVGATSTWLGMRLDAVYTRDVEVGAHHVEAGIRESDHLPMWADLRL